MTYDMAFSHTHELQMQSGLHPEDLNLTYTGVIGIKSISSSMTWGVRSINAPLPMVHSLGIKIGTLSRHLSVYD